MKATRMMIMTAVLALFGVWAYADECNSLRYSDNYDGTVTDCRTGLIWLKDAECTDTVNYIPNPNGQLTWYIAMKWVAGLGYSACGLSDGSVPGDWRLPTKTEWMAMVASARKQYFISPALTDSTGTAHWTNGDVFNNVQPYRWYWSSTPYSTDTAWTVSIQDGSLGITSKTTADYHYVWPVRGGQSGSFGSLYIE